MITPKELENEIETFVERYSYNTDSVDIALNYCADNYQKLYDSYFQLIKDFEKSNAESQIIKNSLDDDKKQLTNDIEYFTYLFELTNCEFDLMYKKFPEDSEKNKSQDNSIIHDFLDYILYVINMETNMKQQEIEAEKNNELFIPMIAPSFDEFLAYNKDPENDCENYTVIVEKLKSISDDTLKGFLDYISKIINIANLSNEDNDNK